MKKGRIRLNETQLRRVIKESVKKILREGAFYNNGTLKSPYDDPISPYDEYDPYSDLPQELYDKLMEILDKIEGQGEECGAPDWKIKQVQRKAEQDFLKKHGYWY